MREAMRWTPPMNASRPPPTMPRRMRREAVVLEPSIAIWSSRSGNAEHAAVGGVIGAAIGEIVEGTFGDPDDVVGHELSTLARAVLGMLQAAFPFDHGPAFEIIGRHFREDRAE